MSVKITNPMSVLPKIGSDYFQNHTLLGNITKKSDDVGNPSIGDVIGNWFTGNLDYKRAVAQAERAEATSAREAAKAREWSAREARKQREWQEYMSNTAYSRAVKDLKSVGINPYAIGSFNASSTPSGAYGQSFAGSGYSSSSNVSHNVASSALNAVSAIIKLVSSL